MSKAEIVEEGGDPGSPSGLDRLYREHRPWLTTRLRARFGLDAEDIVQEAWLRVLASPPFAIRHPRALLLKVASNIGINRARQTRRRAELLAEAAPSEWGHHGADQAEALMLQDIILSLPQPLRDVFVLSRIGGLTHNQIAERLGISPKTVEWRMTRALAHCAAQLRR